MSEKLLKNLQELTQSIEVNAPCVEAKLSNTGNPPDNAVVIAVAKYRDALERLADE